MDKVITLIEESFLAPYLEKEDITDISFNGRDLYYFSSLKGRVYVGVVENNKVANFLRNAANYANERFSYTDTFLDLSIGKYRLSAMHYAVSRYGFNESLSFSLRINHDFLLKHPHYLSPHLEVILTELMAMNRSLIISGATGTGKTTLQKYLITRLKPYTRVLVIDNVLELGEVSSLHPKLDLTLWQTKTNDSQAIKDLIQKALRFHPDYLLIAESRGEEMREILQGALSGHPNIVTIHAESAALSYDRVAHLSAITDKKILYSAYPIIIHLARKEGENGVIIRYIATITTYDPHSGEHTIIYEERA